MKETSKRDNYKQINTKYYKEVVTLEIGGGQLQEKILELEALVWEEEKLPMDWSRVHIYLLPKKDDKLTCENNRGITLLDTCYKILARSLRRKLNYCTENIVEKYQADFQTNRSYAERNASYLQ